MFKSLHHVPADLMKQALGEVHRVLKPGGSAYISEPVYAGDFNDVLRLFHDEREVRLAAFEALVAVVGDGLFTLTEERFFNLPIHFDHFEEFETKVIRVTHTDHRLSPDLFTQVRERFMNYMGEDGASFAMPIRVDLLRKPAVKYAAMEYGADVLVVLQESQLAGSADLSRC